MRFSTVFSLLSGILTSTTSSPQPHCLMKLLFEAYSPNEIYLVIYNSVSALSWCIILLITLNDVRTYPSPSNIYISREYTDHPHKFLLILQLANALIEIGHSVYGYVKSPIPTLLLQFTARLLITIGITYSLPDSPGNFCFPAFVGLSIAWSITEIIRYSYYAFKLISPDNIPYQLVWLRYTSFYVLYPLGLVSEAYVVYLSLEAAGTGFYHYFLVFGLFMYIPGFLTLYTYMIKQRRKVLNRQLKFKD